MVRHLGAEQRRGLPFLRPSPLPATAGSRGKYPLQHLMPPPRPITTPDRIPCLFRHLRNVPLNGSAGVAMSWREFRFNLRPIALLAFGYVLFTTCTVAAMAHWLLGMPLAVALCSAPLWHQPTRSRRCLSCANWAFRVGLLSFLKEK